VISTVVEFDESTAFERWVLGGIVPLGSPTPHVGARDTIANSVIVQLGGAIQVSVVGPGGPIQIDVRPLAFASAWKVLDLMVELSIGQAGALAAPRPTIAEKAQVAKSGITAPASLGTAAGLWRRLELAYDATVETRHALVHRRADFDPATGQLVGYDSSGNALSPLTSSELEAFCRAVQRTADGVVASRQSSRETADLAWQLDQLAALHGLPPVGGRAIDRMPRCDAPPAFSGSLLMIDAPALLADMQRSFSALMFDWVVMVPDGRKLAIELEEVPAGTTTPDLAGPLPTWVRVV
jgi:hypothetical protein